MNKPSPYSSIDPGWPKAGTLPYKLARYLTAYAPRHGGAVPIQPFFDTNDVTYKQILRALHQLRTKFKYYCVMRREVVTCALAWPEMRLSRDWNETHSAVPKFIPIPDPRLGAPTIQFKFTVPSKTNGPVLHEIATYIVRHRDPSTHIVNATYLYNNYGTKRVLNKFSVLNKKYGYRIESVGKNMWHVTKIPNRKV